MSIDEATKAGLPWYRTLNATQWTTLLASNLGWIFDGFEAFALIPSVVLAMRQLFSPADLANLPTYAGGINHTGANHRWALVDKRETKVSDLCAGPERQLLQGQRTSKLCLNTHFLGLKVSPCGHGSRPAIAGQQLPGRNWVAAQ
jgi:hypothetical protein